jgi:hypothetical protein
MDALRRLENVAGRTYEWISASVAVGQTTPDAFFRAVDIVNALLLTAR